MPEFEQLLDTFFRQNVDKIVFALYHRIDIELHNDITKQNEQKKSILLISE